MDNISPSGDDVSATAEPGCPRSGRPLSQAYNPFAQDQADDPFPIWSEARKNGGVFYSDTMNCWVISTYEDVTHVLMSNAVFLNGIQDMRLVGPPEVQEILKALPPKARPLREADGADHARRRKITQNAFSRQRVHQLEEPIRQIANTLVDRFHDLGQCDFYKNFAYPFPLAVISKMLGLDDGDAEKLHYWANALVSLLWGNMNLEQHINAARALVDFHFFIEEQVRKRLATPHDDLIGDMIALNAEAQSPVTFAELVEQVHGLVVAGHETSANWLTLSLFHMLRQPGAWESLADPMAMTKAMEETLRFEGPVLGIFRVAGTDVDLAGVSIKAGDKLFCALGSANRDTSIFGDAEHLTLTRAEASKHVAFGRGVHTCPGSPAAKLEWRVAFDVLRKRLRNPRLLQDRLSFRPSSALHIPIGLEIGWDA